VSSGGELIQTPQPPSPSPEGEGEQEVRKLKLITPGKFLFFSHSLDIRLRFDQTFFILTQDKKNEKNHDLKV
jgi:hypothetical protein